MKDAYATIEHLPPHATFGGLNNQRLREKGKITREEYKKRRNSIIYARGDKTKAGNLNLRLLKSLMRNHTYYEIFGSEYR